MIDISTSFHTTTIAGAAVLLAIVAGVAVIGFTAQAGASVDTIRGDQLLVSQTASGAVPNAPAQQPVISFDKRTAVAIAYTSKATDIVSRSSGGVSNIFLVTRRPPYDASANQPWAVGTVEMASRGRRAPNGDSWDPALSGDDTHAAKCLVFLSKASNLVARDRNRKADIFVRRLSSNGLKRIEAEGAPSSVSVDGACKHIAYSSSKGVFVTTIGGETERVASGRSSNVTISIYGNSVSFEKRGSVYAWRHGSRVTSIGRGGEARLLANGRGVLYEQNGTVFLRNLLDGTTTIGSGSEPAATLTGTFVFWVSGMLVEATGLNGPGAGCSTGPGSPYSSAHGNYLIYLCDRTGSRQVYLSYIGSESHGQN